ncbi:MAG: sigma-70 family RNA polymerase sigma factor [Cyanobacteria bacterium J06638_20]
MPKSNTDTAAIKLQTAELFVKYLECKRSRLSRFPVTEPSSEEIRWRNKIAELNWGLVVKQAQKAMRICSEPRDDLLSEGSIGLISAIEGYDPTKGAAFSSFAIPKIYGAIQHYLRDNRFLHKVSQTGAELASRIRNLKIKLAKHGRIMSEEQIAIEVFELTSEQWADLDAETRSQTAASLDESEIDLPCHPSAIAEREWEQAQLQRTIAIAMSQLPTDEQQALRFVIWHDWPLKAVAARINCSEVEAGVIYQSALRHLRELGYDSGDRANDSERTLTVSCS